MKLVLKYFPEAVKSGPRQFLTSMAMIAALTAVEIMIPWLLRRFVGRIAAEYSAGILAAGIAFLPCSCCCRGSSILPALPRWIGSAGVTWKA